LRAPNIAKAVFGRLGSGGPGGEFRQLCEEAELKSEPEFLLDYLHRAGVVFYRKDIFADRIRRQRALLARRTLRL
jgi:hypothetical protein